MNENKFICKICGAEVNYGEDSAQTHIETNHLIRYSKYYEYCKLDVNKNECPECRKRLYRLNPWSNYILPCCICNDQKLYYKKLSEIVCGWENYIINGKYSSLWLVNSEYRDRFLNFLFSDIDKLIDKIKQRDKIKIDSVNLFEISSSIGSSHEISERNINNLSLTTSRYHFDKKDFKFNKSLNGYEFMVGKHKYSIILPELCDYNNKTYYRYSIFNSDTSRLIRRLKISSSTCIKFYNTISSNYKSILALKKNGEFLNSSIVSDDVFEYIKFYILRNKHLLSNIFNIYNELLKYSSNIQDNVFLLNKIYVNNLGKGDIKLTWRPENIFNNKINISII
jgi:hypothetical protein